VFSVPQSASVCLPHFLSYFFLKPSWELGLGKDAYSDEVMRLIWQGVGEAINTSLHIPSESNQEEILPSR